MDRRSGSWLVRALVTPSPNPETQKEVKEEPEDLQSVDTTSPVANEFLEDGHFLFRDEEDTQEGQCQDTQDFENSVLPPSSDQSLGQRMSESESLYKHHQMDKFKEEFRLLNVLAQNKYRAQNGNVTEETQKLKEGNRKFREENKKLKEENQKLKEENQKLQEKVKKLEEDHYSLSIIADYEIGKLKNKWIAERRRRIQTEQNLRIVIQQSEKLHSGNGQQIVGARRIDDDNDIEILDEIENSATISNAAMLPPHLSNNSLIQDKNPNNQESSSCRPRPGPKSRTKQFVGTCQSTPVVQSRADNGTADSAAVNSVSNMIPIAPLNINNVSNQKLTTVSVPIPRTQLARAKKLGLFKGETASAQAHSHQMEVSSNCRMPDFKFRCNLCSSSFFKVSELRLHKLTAHNIDDNELDRIGCVDCGLTFLTRKEHMGHRQIVHGTRVGKKKKNFRRTIIQLNTFENAAVTSAKQIPVAEVSENAEIVKTILKPEGKRVLPSRVRKTPMRITSGFVHVFGTTSGASGTIGTSKHRLIGPDPKKSIALYRCSCGKVYQMRKSFRMHIKFKNVGKIFNCSLCDKRFDNHSSLKQHVRCFHRQEYNEGRYGCGECGLRGLETLEELKRHRLEVHRKTSSRKYHGD